MKRTITFRIDDELLEMMEEAKSSLPYPATSTAILVRGINLAIDEIKRMASQKGGAV
nr:hypothetical protein [Agrobacterium tumefaciens]